ncbi:hypothetical protein [Aquimarina sediminis]|uniref:hypothetical protein n=1 Tax=Aquimarina sediminis TaxID=2070536 RepID=UPI000FFE76F2|nr:hypothetical protein [Aquimarina sediminis]
MNLYKSVFASFMIVTNIFSQEKITLNTVPFETDNVFMYIKDVIDERENKILGEIENEIGKTTILKLHPNASQAIQNFMDTSFPYSENAKPIYIKIKALQIQQSQSSINDLTTRVHINLVFLEKNNNVLKELYTESHYEEQVFSISNKIDVFDTHEKRIRAALEHCIQSFINDYSKEHSHNKETKNKIHNTPKSQYNTQLGNWYNILTYKRAYSKHTEGWKINYVGFADSDKDFIIPFVLSYDRYSIKPKSLKDKGYKSVNSYTLGGGFDGYLKVHPGVYLNLGIEIPIGIEISKTTKDKKNHNFLIGVGTKQGIKIIPWKDHGITIGAGLFQQIQTSKIYSKNFGFELELGINF